MKGAFLTPVLCVVSYSLFLWSVQSLSIFEAYIKGTPAISSQHRHIVNNQIHCDTYNWYCVGKPRVPDCHFKRQSLLCLWLSPCLLTAELDP